MIILGIDASSTTVGWGVLEVINDKIKLLDYGYFKPSKKGSVFERLSKMRLDLSKILDKYNPDHIAIEEISKYMPGKSSANTIIQLAIFNRFVGQYCYDYTGRNPNMLNVLSIRHKIKLSKKLPDKSEIPSIIEERLKITLKKELNKNGKEREENYDTADGIACGLAFALKLIEGKK